MKGNGNGAGYIVYRIPAYSTRDKAALSPGQRWLLITLAAFVILTAGYIRFGIIEQRDPPGARSLIGQDLIGYTIADPAGTSVGHVVDVALDAEEGTVTYLILEVDHAFPAGKATMAGVNSVLIPVPWSHVTVREDTRVLSLDVSEDTLANAPRLVTLPDMRSSADWETRVHQYWTDR